MVCNSSINFPKIPEFVFNLCCVKPGGVCDYEDDLPHSHNKTEIYINLSGDVCFIIERRVYRIKRGSVLIIAPEIMHNCAYNNRRSPHGHYWITAAFNKDDWIGKQLFKDAPDGVVYKNLNADELEQVEALLGKLLENGCDGLENLAALFAFLNLLGSADSKLETAATVLPDDVSLAVDFISKNYRQQVYITDIAAMANVSINTLERHFSSYFGKSPKGFLKECRLNSAASALKSGRTVQQASDGAGFSDCSHFISDFTHFFGITPKKYKQKYEKNR